MTTTVVSTKNAELNEFFKCTCEELFNVFNTAESLTAFTKSPATINPIKGGTFTMKNGDITGQFIEVDRPNKFVKTWRTKNWPEGHCSTLTMNFQKKDNGTWLTLNQTGIPESDYENTIDAWKKCVFEPIKSTFGY